MSKQIALLRAINNRDLVEVDRLISNGADPLGMSDNTNLLHQAVSIGDPLVLARIINYAKNKGITINLSQHLSADNVHTPYNLLQFACLHSPNPIIEKLAEYCEDTGQDKARLMNAEIIVHKNGSPASLQDVSGGIIRVISSDSLVYNMEFKFDGHSPKAVAAKQKYVIDWFLCSPYKTPPLSVGVIEVFYGPQKTLELLLRLGLALKSRNTRLDSLLNMLITWTSDLKYWPELKAFLTFNKRIEIIGEPELVDGLITFTALVKNKFNAHPIPFRITLDYRPSYDLVCKAIEAQQMTAPGLAILNAKQQQLAAEQREMKETISTIPSVMLDQIRAKLSSQTECPQALQFFNTIQKRVDIYLNAMLLATSGRFKVKATSDAARIALHLNAVFAVLAQNTSVPLVGVVAAVSTGVVELATQMYAEKQAKGVFNATLGQNIERLSTYIAVIILCEAMNKNKNAVNAQMAEKIASKIKGQIDKLQKLDNQQELLAFLCAPAIELLRGERNSNNKPLVFSKEGSNSSGSSTSAGHKKNSGDLAVVASADSDEFRTTAKAASPGCCIVS